MMMSGSLFRGPLVAAALVAATSFSGSLLAQSGRLSLAERVAQLEAQNQGQGGSQSTVDLLNRIDELQSEVQSLRGLVEKQAFEIEELKKRGRDQYVDLDSRISRLEGNPLGAAPEPAVSEAGASTMPATTPDLAPIAAAPGQLTMDDPIAPLAETQPESAPIDATAALEPSPAQAWPVTTSSSPTCRLLSLARNASRRARPRKLP